MSDLDTMRSLIAWTGYEHSAYWFEYVSLLREENPELSVLDIKAQNAVIDLAKKAKELGML